MSHRPSPFENPAGRQSPFGRRQNSASPATVKGVTPTPSPTKAAASLSPTKTSTLSPEKTSPFVRRPSQISHASDRPTSPFARPTSSLSITTSPPRGLSNTSEADLTSRPLGASTTSIAPDTPTFAPVRPSTYDGARLSSEEPQEDIPSFIPPSPANLRPVAQRSTTSSTTATIKPPVFTTQLRAVAAPKLNAVSGGGAYNHISQPLLHSMRESFEVLDSSNSGTVDSAAVSDMLSQLGLDNRPAALKDFFPPSAPAQLNLARYLDSLCGPLGDLSQSDELKAAFEAFDVDDSGQIDVGVLRDALLHTAPQPGEDMIRLGEREVDGILGEFTSRRAFGSKGVSAAKSKGEVFRYRDFMANVSGTSAATGPDATIMV